jgi:hypothetical protein
MDQSLQTTTPIQNTVGTIAVEIKLLEARTGKKTPSISDPGKATIVTYNSETLISVISPDEKVRLAHLGVYMIIDAKRSKYRLAEEDEFQWTTTTFKIPTGDYEHISQIIDILQRQIMENATAGGGPSNSPDFIYNSNAATVSFTGAELWIATHEKFMRQTFGFTKAYCTDTGYCIFAYGPYNFPARLPYPLKTIYVYCDVVEHNLVGDASVPLLRTINVPTEQERNVNMVFNRPYYRPVSRGYINSIEMQLSDKSGELIPFDLKAGCETLCVLHFRKSPIEI